MGAYIGYRKYLTETDMKAEYLTLRDQNLTAAQTLEKQALYNEAIYFYIQAMEKEIKGYICGKVNATNPYFSQKLRDIGHSLDDSIDFVIEILAGNNETLKNQLIEQIKVGVFQNIKFSKLYNDCRYPAYHMDRKQYYRVILSKEDCERVSGISRKLTQYIHDFDKI